MIMIELDNIIFGAKIRIMSDRRQSWEHNALRWSGLNRYKLLPRERFIQRATRALHSALPLVCSFICAFEG